MTGQKRNISAENITPEIIWTKYYGRDKNDVLCSIKPASDGGYILAGWTETEGTLGLQSDYYIVKVNEEGNKEWLRIHGQKDINEYATSMAVTSDGGYILAGYATAYGAKEGADLYSEKNIYILKVDFSGKKKWDSTESINQLDNYAFIEEVSGGGYILAGNTANFTSPNPSWIFVLRLALFGARTWEKIYPLQEYTSVSCIKETVEGGYILTGSKVDSQGKTDIYVAKLDLEGKVVWEDSFGGAGYDMANSIEQTRDRGYILAGKTASPVSGEEDFYILKLDKEGKKLWDKTFGGKYKDSLKSIIETKDGYIAAGDTYSFGEGNKDMYVIRLNGEGNKIWDKTVGGPEEDSAAGVLETSDEAFIIAGTTQSFGKGGNNFYIVKIK